VREKAGTSTPQSIFRAVLPSTFHTGLSIAATEAAKWLVCGRNEGLEGRIVTLDMLSLTKQTHILVQPPQRPPCGGPQALAAKQAASLVLQSCRKLFTHDGGHHGLTPEETVKKLEHHISPLTGIVHTLRPISTRTVEQSLTPSYVTGHNFVYVSKDDS